MSSAARPPEGGARVALGGTGRTGRTDKRAEAASDLNALRDEVCRVGASLFNRGYVHATAGNISVRTEHGFLITPTDACLGTLDPARLAAVGHDGVQTSGDPASKTLALHRRIHALLRDEGGPCAAAALPPPGRPGGG